MRTRRSELAPLERRLDELAAQTDANHERVIHALRIVSDDDAGAGATLWKLRGNLKYSEAFEDEEPLVTVRPAPDGG